MRRGAKTFWMVAATATFLGVLVVVGAVIVTDAKLAETRQRLGATTTLEQYDQLTRVEGSGTADAGASAAAPVRSEGRATDDSLRAYAILFGAFDDWQARHEDVWTAFLGERQLWLRDGLGQDTLRRWHELSAGQDDLLNRIRRTAALGGPSYRLDLSAGIAMPLPHLPRLAQMGDALLADALVRGHMGDYETFADTVAALLQLSETLANEPVILSQLTRVGLLERAFDALGRGAPGGSLSPEDAARIAALSAGLNTSGMMSGALAGETAGGSGWFDVVRSGNANLESGSGSLWGRLVLTVYSSPVGTPLVNRDEIAYLEGMEEYGEVALLPYFEAAPRLDEIEARLAGLGETYVVSRTPVPDYRRAIEAQARAEAITSLIQTGLAVEQHHAAHGEYPRDLGAVTQGLPPGATTDPFTGQPLVYRAHGDGFTLYSLGQNMTDNGGRHHYRDGDIVWRGVWE